MVSPQMTGSISMGGGTSGFLFAKEEKTKVNYAYNGDPLN